MIRLRWTSSKSNWTAAAALADADRVEIDPATGRVTVIIAKPGDVEDNLKSPGPSFWPMPAWRFRG
jgi:hypothetical protein